jgi:hypothetical protein
MYNRLESEDYKINNNFQIMAKGNDSRRKEKKKPKKAKK